MSSMNPQEMKRLAEAEVQAQAQAQAWAAHDTQADASARGLAALVANPIYQVRRVLRVTQMAWDLPLAAGRRARRLARRGDAPRLSAPRPGQLAALATG